MKKIILYATILSILLYTACSTSENKVPKKEDSPVETNSTTLNPE